MAKLVIEDPVEAVRFCENHASVVVERISGWTALHTAAEGGHVEAAELLIEKGLRVDAQDRDGDTPLHMAAQEGHGGVVLLLLRRGCDVNVANMHGGTALHRAAAHGRTEVVQLLMECGADTELLSKKGHSALEMAEAHGHNGVAELLRPRQPQVSSAEQSLASVDAAVLRALAPMASSVSSQTSRDEADVHVRTLVAALRQIGDRATVLNTLDRIQERGFPEPAFAYTVAALSIRKIADAIWPASTGGVAKGSGSRRHGVNTSVSEEERGTVHQQQAGGSAPWYVASSRKPRMEQLVLNPGALEFRDESRMLLLTGLYLRVYRSFWISALLKLDYAECPVILIKANEATSFLRSQPLKIAFSFIKGATGNMFALFVEFAGPAPFSCPTKPLVFFEDIQGLDHAENRDRLRTHLDVDRFDVWLAEGGSAKVVGDVMSAESIDVKYAASLPIEPACRAKLKEFVEQHFAEHLRIGPHSWDFERSSQDFMHDLPVSVPPILADPNATRSVRLGSPVINLPSGLPQDIAMQMSEEEIDRFAAGHKVHCLNCSVTVLPRTFINHNGRCAMCRGEEAERRRRKREFAPSGLSDGEYSAFLRSAPIEEVQVHQGSTREAEQVSKTNKWWQFWR